MRDSRVRSLQPTGNEARLMQYYVPFGQQPEPFVHSASQVSAMLVRSVGDPQRIMSSAQRFIQGASPTPVYARVHLYEDLLDPQLRPWRLGATLFSALGGLALVLGGSGASIAGLVVGGALRLVGVGAMIGAIAAVVLTPFVQSMLFQTSMRDVRVVLSITGVLSAVALAAATLPALRAARVNPSVTLQAE